MHDYLATDGHSIRPVDEEADARRQLYSGYRDKNKVCLTATFSCFIMLTTSETIQIVRG
jgi:hypothetical protein